MILALVFACRAPDVGTRRAPTARPAPTLPAPTTPTATGSTGSTGDTAAPLTPFVFVGSADGYIRLFTLDPSTGALTPVQYFAYFGYFPSFLAFSHDRRHLYAVMDATNELQAYDLRPNDLAFDDVVSANGVGPVALTLDATDRYLLAANYGDGSVTSVAVDANGWLQAAISTLHTGENAHQIVLAPDNSFAFVPNLGSDTVSQLAFDPNTGALTPNPVPTVTFPAGSGPRHLAFHPFAPFAYVIDETDDTMVALAYDPIHGQLSPIQTLSTLPPGADAANSYCAEVAFGADGRFLYGSNRGDDSLVQYEVDPVSGLMTLVGFTSTEGSWPRHFSLSPDGARMYVGNQYSDEVVVFAIDPVDGTLARMARTSVPSPEWVGEVDL